MIKRELSKRINEHLAFRKVKAIQQVLAALRYRLQPQDLPAEGKNT